MTKQPVQHHTIIYDGNGRLPVARQHIIGTLAQAQASINRFAEARHLAYSRTYIFSRDIVAGIRKQQETRAFSARMGY